MEATFSTLLPQILPRLIDAAVRGAIVLLAALALTTLLRRRSAAARHAVWVGAIAAQLLLLVLSVWGPRWRVAAPEPVSALIPVMERETPAASPAPLAPSSNATVPRAPAPSTDSAAPSSLVVPPSEVRFAEPAPAPVAPISGRTLLGALWALGALAVLLRLAVGTTMVARLARSGDRIHDGGWLSLAQRLSSTLRIQRPLILMRGDRIGVPITWGIVYPIVLLPDDADSWPEERRRFVLVHEMAHVKRLDALTQLIGQVALALFWFDPLVWVATRRMQLEREHACDDYVLRHGTQPSQYANDLLEMVRALGTPAHRGAQPAFAALAMARRSEFEGRMLSILDPVLDRHPLSRGRTLMSALASLLVVVPLAALQPYRPMAQASVSPSTATSVAARSSRTTISAADSHAATGTDRPLSERVNALDSARVALGARMNGLDQSRATIASSATVASASTKGDNDSCDGARFDGKQTSTHIHANEDAHSGSDVRFLDFDRDHCLEARIRGKYVLSGNEDHVVSLTPGSRVYLRERTAGADRAIDYTSTDGLNISRDYRLNGTVAPIDDAANAWIAAMLPTVLAELAINVEPRVARWRAEGGVDGTLRHIASLKSSGAKRAHYEALLDARGLKPDEAQRLVQQAGRTLPSSGDLRSVLSKAAPQVRVQSASASALEAAISAVASSGDRAAVLELYGQTDDRDVLLAVMRVALTVPSSGDKANLLSAIASRYLAKSDAPLRDAFFRTAITIPSSGDLASVLDDIMPFAVKSTDVALALIDAATHVASSGDRSGVLMTLAEKGGARAAAVRDAYLRAAQDIPSSSDMRSVLEALNRH